jgi:putative transposase
VPVEHVASPRQASVAVVTKARLLRTFGTKYCLAATVTATSRGQDVLACLRRAVAEAERVPDVDDLRADRGMMDVVDADDFVIGQAPAPIAVVTGNGPYFRGTGFADAFTGDYPLLGTSEPE